MLPSILQVNCDVGLLCYLDNAVAFDRFALS